MVSYLGVGNSPSGNVVNGMVVGGVDGYGFPYEPAFQPTVNNSVVANGSANNSVLGGGSAVPNVVYESDNSGPLILIGLVILFFMLRKK